MKDSREDLRSRLVEDTGFCKVEMSKLPFARFPQASKLSDWTGTRFTGISVDPATLAKIEYSRFSGDGDNHTGGAIVLMPRPDIGRNNRRFLKLRRLL